MRSDHFGVPVATVVIPTHDRVELLRQAVASVYAQTLGRWELVIVDDASDDGTPSFLASIGDRRVRTLRLDENAERSAARNIGMREARAPYVVFLDDDDRLLPSALDRLVRAVEAHPEAVAAVGGRDILGPDGDHRRAPHPRLPHVRNVWTDVFFDWVGFPSQTIFRLEPLQQVGGWNERVTLGEDRELWLRIARRGPVVFVPSQVVQWRMHADRPTQSGAGATRERRQRARAESLDRNHVAGAERLLEAAERWRAGVDAYEVGRYREATSDFLHSVWRAPSALASPLVGPNVARMTARAMFGCLFGTRVIEQVRRARRGIVDWARAE